MSKRVVVTGATGNVGTSVVRALSGDARVGEIIGISRRAPAITIQKTRWVQADVARDGESKAKITLAKADSLPNKDFVVRYAVMGKKPEMAVLGHTGNYTDTKRLEWGVRLSALADLGLGLYLLWRVRVQGRRRSVALFDRIRESGQA